MNTILLVLTLLNSNTCIAWVDVTNINIVSLTHIDIASVAVFSSDSLSDNLADYLYPNVYKDVKLSEGIIATVQCN